jgi:hypothetical protein
MFPALTLPIHATIRGVQYEAVYLPADLRDVRLNTENSVRKYFSIATSLLCNLHRNLFFEKVSKISNKTGSLELCALYEEKLENNVSYFIATK